VGREVANFKTAAFSRSATPPVCTRADSDASIAKRTLCGNGVWALGGLPLGSVIVGLAVAMSVGVASSLANPCGCESCAVASESHWRLDTG
jgi:hypothetical protein